MAVGRKKDTGDRAEVLSEAFKAMGDRTRLAIIMELLQDERCVSDLGKILSLETPAVSFHLTKLRYSGLVVNERRGQQMFYRINPSLLKTGQGSTTIELEGCSVQFTKRS
jgi:DNA-binding transcriptional ArsR family regulator